MNFVSWFLEFHRCQHAAQAGPSQVRRIGIPGHASLGSFKLVDDRNETLDLLAGCFLDNLCAANRTAGFL